MVHCKRWFYVQHFHPSFYFFCKPFSFRDICESAPVAVRTTLATLREKQNAGLDEAFRQCNSNCFSHTLKFKLFMRVWNLDPQSTSALTDLYPDTTLRGVTFNLNHYRLRDNVIFQINDNYSTYQCYNFRYLHFCSSNLKK